MNLDINREYMILASLSDDGVARAARVSRLDLDCHGC